MPSLRSSCCFVSVVPYVGFVLSLLFLAINEFLHLKRDYSMRTTKLKCVFKFCVDREGCGDVQSDQGLLCLLTELLATTECMNGEQRPR